MGSIPYIPCLQAPEGWDDVAPQLEEFANQMWLPETKLVNLGNVSVLKGTMPC